jgi:ubiquinol-cytochrome c reductase cytochrome c1 subunit
MNSLKALFLAVALLVSGASIANSGGAPLDRAPDLSNNKAELQRGAKLFVNYCLNCHSASAMRYNRLKDIGLSNKQIETSLLFSADKVGETMKVALTAKDAKEWFGAAPPDLSVIARAKSGEKGSGADYIYTYLRSYYRDASRPTGWNNVAYPGSAMPHILWDLQPTRALEKTEIVHIASPAVDTKEAKDAKPAHAASEAHAGFEKVVTTYGVTGEAYTVKTEMPHYEGHGGVTYKFINEEKNIAAQQAFDQDAAAITAFMQYMADPSASTRQALGVWVLLFLGVFILLAYLLNKEYWKDIK